MAPQRSEQDVEATASSPAAGKLYSPPKLRVFGSVAAITSSISMTGNLKDGGPNNLKT